MKYSSCVTALALILGLIAAGIVPAQAADESAALKDKIALGKQVFDSNCMACHQANGKGIENIFPPLAGSDLLNQDPKRMANIVVHGLTGDVTVNGTKYSSVMPPVDLSDEEVANVATYVLNSWGNKGGQLLSADVAEQRKASPFDPKSIK